MVSDQCHCELYINCFKILHNILNNMCNYALITQYICNNAI